MPNLPIKISLSRQNTDNILIDNLYLPMPAATRYMAEGHPRPPAPMITAEPFLRANCPVQNVIEHLISLSHVKEILSTFYFKVGQNELTAVPTNFFIGQC